MKLKFIFLIFLFSFSYHRLDASASCSPNVINYKAEMTNINHIGVNGQNYFNDISKVHFTNFFNWKAPDHYTYKIGSRVDVNKIFQSPYGKRGVNGVQNAYYYFEWWSTGAAIRRCASFNSNSLHLNSDGSIQVTGNDCPSGLNLTVDVVSQCHMHNPSLGASGIGFWWSVTGFGNNINSPNVAVNPRYQGATIGTCILDATPYGCNATDHS